MPFCGSSAWFFIIISLTGWLSSHQCSQFSPFRRFRLKRKATANFAVSARVSACISAAASGRISMKFDIVETFTKICRETPDLFQIGQHYLTLPLRPMYVYIVFHRMGKKLSVRVRNFRHFRLSRETRVMASSCLSADLSACLSSCMNATPTG